MNIGIFGMGGIGGYFGGKLTRLIKSGDANIYFIARGEHLAAIRENGLTLKTKDEGEYVCVPTLATDNPGKLPQLDICLICVKQYALKSAVASLLPAITENTILVPLQNGIDAYSKIRSVTDKGTIFPACVYIVTHRTAPGTVEQSGGGCNIILGPDPKKPEIPGDETVRLLTGAGITCRWSERNLEEVWSKFMFVAPFSLVLTADDLTYGQVFESDRASGLIHGIIDEIFEISRAEGIKLPEDSKEAAFEKARNFPYGGKTSFQLDFSDPEKQDERETFGQAVIDLGRHYSVPTPVTDSVYRRLMSMSPKTNIIAQL
ncbi:MAG: ketopantoate reductase family protein [Oscillospiraceae bacterium]